jgi:hypothetical protein
MKIIVNLNKKIRSNTQIKEKIISNQKRKNAI